MALKPNLLDLLKKMEEPYNEGDFPPRVEKGDMFYIQEKLGQLPALKGLSERGLCAAVCDASIVANHLHGEPVLRSTVDIRRQLEEGGLSLHTEALLADPEVLRQTLERFQAESLQQAALEAARRRDAKLGDIFPYVGCGAEQRA